MYNNLHSRRVFKHIKKSEEHRDILFSCSIVMTKQYGTDMWIIISSDLHINQYHKLEIINYLVLKIKEA